MCGRLNIHDHPGILDLLDALGIPLRLPEDALPPARHNIAPSASLLIALAHGDETGAVPAHWGITPRWARPDQFQRPLINARAETAWDKPSFRHSMAERRCLLPVDGFYEWRRDGKARTPFHFGDPAGGKLLLGALYEYDASGQPCFAILTTAANETMAPIHDRQPVLLPSEAVSDWLFSRDRAQLDCLIQPASAPALCGWQVTAAVNDARHDGTDCAAPLDDLFPDPN